MSIVQVTEKKLIGLGLKNKTTNTNGQSSIDCGSLWSEFHKHKYGDAITAKLSNDIFGVYYDYEGDHNHPFSYFIGYEVNDISSIPSGLQSLTIPAGAYEKITAKGVMPECVTNVWKHIWQTAYARTFQVDFEIYDERSKDWNKAEVDVYLSVK